MRADDQRILDQVVYETTEALKVMKDTRFSPTIRLVAALNLRDDLADIVGEYAPAP